MCQVLRRGSVREWRDETPTLRLENANTNGERGTEKIQTLLGYWYASRVECLRCEDYVYPHQEHSEDECGPLDIYKLSFLLRTRIRVL